MTKNWLNAFLQDEQGQDLVEYALLLALVTLAAVAILTTLGTHVSNLFNKVQSQLVNAGG